MRKFCLFFLICIKLASENGHSQSNLMPKSGRWHGELSLNDRLYLPFEIDISIQKKKPILVIRNGDEKITLILNKKKNGFFYYHFPEMDSELILCFNENGVQLSGDWINYNKAKPVSIPFTAYLNAATRFLVSGQPSKNYTGRWDVLFKDGDEHAIGLFKQEGNEITGTFLTETGDYRYLSGNVDENNTLYLSCFDGAHAYQFVAHMSGKDEVSGLFYSGQSYQTSWEGKRSDLATLKDPDSITRLIDNTAFSFNATTLKGKTYQFTPKAKTGTIIQIMGSWCPNCIDETNYFKEIYNEYKRKGFEFIAVSFELGKDKKEQLIRLKGFINRCKIPYLVLLGGKKGAEEASSVFSTLTKIVGFPTTIILDKNGVVRRIHTGFSGPGTGIEFLNYKSETEKLLNEITQEN